MTITSRRQSDSESLRHSPPENSPPHFFKFVDSVTVKKLKIPPKFARKNGEILLDTIFLKVPNGEDSWRVESKKCENGDVWFDRGWQDFVDFYSIKAGDFLVFRYEGNALFFVLIFDKTATEIDYPFKNEVLPIFDKIDTEIEYPFKNENHCEEINIDVDEKGLKVPKMEDDDGVSIEIIDDFPSSQTRKEKRPLYSQSNCSSASRMKMKEPRRRSDLMPNTRRRQSDTESLRPIPPENPPPHFFKFVDSVTVKKLKIPPKFARKNGEILLDTIFLKAPNGEESWRVESKKYENGDVWFDRGWQDFVDFYSVKVGDFLVLRYEGNALFFVLIFDKTATEIDYPFKNEVLAIFDKTDTDDDVSVEILDDYFPSSQSRKKARAPSSAKTMNAADRVRLEAKEINGGMQPKVQKRRWQTHVVSEAFEKAKTFKSKNHFFIVTMRLSYVSAYILNIPMPFVRIRFNMRINNILLQVSDEKTWSVKYVCDLGGSGGSKLTVGWREFVRDNHLKVDDVCVFELINNVENLLRVIIFRAK